MRTGSVRWRTQWLALPPSEYERLEPHLQWVAMPLGEVIYEPDTPLRHVYFPTTSIVSLLYVMADGASAEIAVVGNEGILGISLFMAAKPPPAVRWCKARAGLSPERKA